MTNSQRHHNAGSKKYAGYGRHRTGPTALLSRRSITNLVSGRCDQHRQLDWFLPKANDFASRASRVKGRW